jgi:Lar family restriction alleviation protein
MSILDIKPCPFCGNDDQTEFVIEPGLRYVNRSVQICEYVEYVVCRKCFSRGPMRVRQRTHGKAIHAWNKRAP